MSATTTHWSAVHRNPWSGRRTALWIALMPLLVLVQAVLIAILPMPWAVPDVVLVTVLGLAHHRGAVSGGLYGVWAGMLLDLLPPAVGPFGGWALVLGLVGIVHGHVVATRRPGPLLALGVLALSAVGATGAHALILWFAGVPVSGAAVATAALGAGGWALVLAPLALLLTGGRIGAEDPREQLERDPMLLEAVTPGWAGSPAVTRSAHAAPSRQAGGRAEPAERAGGALS